MLYCLQKDGENGNNNDPGDSDKHFGGGGASNDDSYDDGKEEDKEGLDEVKARLSSLVINTSSWENTTETFIATVDSLIKLAATNKALAEALRATKGLSKISIDDCSLTPLTHRDKNTHLPLYISYPGDQFDTPNIMFKVLEEIFHYGQQITYEGWKDGDLELEAKVFVCQIWLQAGGDEGNYPYHGNKYPDQYIANTILGFYAGSVSFSQIKSVLEDIGYQESDFPFSETAAKDRFKHINKFSKNSEFAK